MTKGIRDGLALLAAAFVCLLLSLVVGEDIGQLLRGAAILLGIGGGVVIVVGLVRQP